MTTPSPFEIARAIGTNIGGIGKEIQDKSAIEEILSGLSGSQNPEQLQQAINQVLTRVSPNRQKTVLESLESRLKGQQDLQKGKQLQEQKFQQQQQLLSGILGDLGTAPMTMSGDQPMDATMTEVLDPPERGEPLNLRTRQLKDRLIPDEKITQVALINPAVATQMQKQNEAIRKEIDREEDQKYKRFTDQRQYETQFSKKAEEKVDDLRETLPKKESSLNLARNAAESGEIGFISLNKLADLTGVDAFRTAKGAQLITASKENLLNNMGRVSARAQNIWFEQRLNSMFPMIGQSMEANLTTQEMLEGELAMDKAYIDEFDRLANEDQESFGFVRKDIARRAQNTVKEKNKEIFDRTTFRMKQIEEQEKGVKKLQSEVGKKVPRGTPLTLVMAKLYQKKYGDKAKDKAKADGYTIPTSEQFRMYAANPQEFRDKL